MSEFCYYNDMRLSKWSGEMVTGSACTAYRDRTYFVAVPHLMHATRAMRA